MKHLIITIILLLTYSEAYSEECVFTGTVYPVEKTEVVKEVYGTACRFFTGTFNAKLDLNIRLDSVRYVDSWEDVSIPVENNVYAFFHNGEVASVNDIYININDYGDIFFQSKVLEDSVIFHEMIHFFFKSANLKYLTENEIGRNGAMEEVLSYWCQNQYIKRVTEGKKDIMDYVQGSTQDFNLLDLDSFIGISDILYEMSKAGFIYQSIPFLDEDPQDTYTGIVNNKYQPEGGPLVY